MFVVTVILVAVPLGIIYFYVKYLYSYWHRRGIPYLKPSFPFGNFGKTFVKKWPMCVQLNQLYCSTLEPFIGIFMLQSPMLLIRDPHLIRSILITDFQYFTDRKLYLNEKDEPLTAHLGALQGQYWRDMRSKLTPAFTPNKTKMMFPVLLNCGSQLQKYLSKVVDASQAIEMCEVISCYASNITASIAFGIDIDCLANPNHPFRNASRQLYDINTKNSLRFIGWFFQPTLLKCSGLRFVDRSIEEYFLNLVTHSLEIREQNGVMRKDYFQLLVNLRNNVSSTSLNKDGWKAATKNKVQTTLTFEQVAAEAFGFILAGVEATSLTTSYCLFEIAKNSDIQQKIHVEIDRIMDEQNGQITYESISKLKYLDCCIDETLRKYLLLDVSRVCVKAYKIPGTNITIEKGTSIVIPTFAVHNDEKFYPDPKKFDPTRFYNENKAGKSINDVPYLAFGDGPRNCIGQRMGKMFVKIGIHSILQKYYIELDDRRYGRDLKFSLNLHPIGGIHLKLNARQ